MDCNRAMSAEKKNLLSFLPLPDSLPPCALRAPQAPPLPRAALPAAGDLKVADGGNPDLARPGPGPGPALTRPGTGPEPARTHCDAL